MDTFTTTARSKVRRLAKRAHYDRKTVHAVLDAGIVCHIGYVIDGQPFVTATGYWRRGDRLYWHGSAASRMLRAEAAGIPVCFAVTHFDGLVLARSGFNHTMNYRSVVAFGRAAKIEDPKEKTAALEAFTERFMPGRWRELRPVTTQELRQTTVLAMTIEEAAAKIRGGPPTDDEEDYALPVWAGVLPVRQVMGKPVPDPRLARGTPRPLHVRTFAPGKGFNDLLARLARGGVAG